MDESAIERLCERFALSFRALRGGLAGERLGRASGGSGEFHDRRAYVPGDDLRHLDWAAYGRSDQMMIRLHREEITPRLELGLDVSASMRSSEAKWQRARELALLFLRLARADAVQVRLHLISDESRSFDEDQPEHLLAVEPTGRAGLERLPHSALSFRPSSLRLLISDLLFEEGAAAIVRRTAQAASGVAVVQVLEDEEAEPSLNGGHRLTDVETGQSADLFLGSDAIAAYRERLRHLQDEWRTELRRAGAARESGGGLAVVLANDDLLEAGRAELVEAGVLTPRP